MKKMSKLNKAELLVDRLIELDADEGLKRRAMQILDRLRLPMVDVLERVPGHCVVVKCAKIGISRQTYYAWLRGTSRPNSKLSKKIAELTGFDWQDIQGKTRLSPPRPSVTLAASSSA